HGRIKHASLRSPLVSRSKERIDEWSDRTARKHHEHGAEQEDKQDRYQPPFLGLNEKAPKFTQEVAIRSFERHPLEFSGRLLAHASLLLTRTAEVPSHIGKAAAPSW